MILKLLIAVFILFFLNIQLQTGPDTINAIWNFLYKPRQDFALLIVISYIGILILIFSSVLKNKFSLPACIIGLCMLCFSGFTFISSYDRKVYGDNYSFQIDDLLKLKYLFLLSIFIIALKLYESKLNASSS